MALKKNKKQMTVNLEVAASACVVMGIALYIAVDVGLLRLPLMKKSTETASRDEVAAALSKINQSGVKTANIKALQDKVDQVEEKMREKVATLSKINEEIEGISKRLANERKSINSMATVVFEIEKGRESLQKEIGQISMTSNANGLNAALLKIANAVRHSGVEGTEVGSVKFKNQDHLRIRGAFEFQETGIYLTGRDLPRAESLADALDDANARDIKVVYRAPADEQQGSDISRDRAFVLRNHLRELLGEDFKIVVSKVTTDVIPPGVVELWVSK